MIGYKGFDKDFKCRNLQYEVSKIYEIKSNPILCQKGFHFCKRLIGVDEYYPFYGWFFGKTLRTSNRYAIVESLGRYMTDNMGKYVTNKIHIIKELSEDEISVIIEEERKAIEKASTLPISKTNRVILS